ncbi:unnamed protein product, partial [Symbiodinium microadriaticum]
MSTSVAPELLPFVRFHEQELAWLVLESRPKHVLAGLTQAMLRPTTMLAGKFAGLIVLGTPRSSVGGAANEDREGTVAPARVASFSAVRVAPQCAWLLLATCASRRANHTVPPQAVASYVHAHDVAIWETLELCLGGIAEADVAHAQNVATLPAALGGLGSWAYVVRFAPRWPHTGLHGLTRYRSSTSVAPAAFAEAPLLATDGGRAPSLRSAVEARKLLQAEGWHECRSWETIGAGDRPPRVIDRGLGDWPHGWQCTASRIRTSYFCERTLLPPQSGPQAGAWLTAIPCELACALPLPTMLLALALRRRL